MKKENGFSIVEIMVSMVVLSIVILVLTNITIVSNLEHSMAKNKDDGTLLAREKLTQLQDPSTIAGDGNDEVVRKGVTYARSWTLSATTPILAKVVVNWNKDNRSHTAEAAGYLEIGNVCQEIVPNNKPTGIRFTLMSGSILYSGDQAEFSHGTASNVALGVFYGIDGDTSKGDVIDLFLTPGVEDNDRFNLIGDTLKTKLPFSDEDADYTIKVVAEDCAGNTYTGTFDIDVGDANSKPHVNSPQNLSVDENSGSGVEVGQFQLAPSDPGPAADITWYINSTGLTINSTTGRVTTTGAVPFDFESQPTINLTGMASRDGEDSTFDVVLSVNDVNEAPTNITLSSYSIDEGANQGTAVGVVSIADPDEHSAVSSWREHLIALAPHGKFYLDGQTIRLSSSGVGNLNTAGETISITATDKNGAGFAFTKSISISVNASMADANCSGVPAFQIWNGSNAVLYNGGWNGATPSKVVYDNKLWIGAPDEHQWYNYNGVPGEMYQWDLVGECQ